MTSGTVVLGRLGAIGNLDRRSTVARQGEPINFTTIVLGPVDEAAVGGVDGAPGVGRRGRQLGTGNGAEIGQGRPHVRRPVKAHQIGRARRQVGRLVVAEPPEVVTPSRNIGPVDYSVLRS